MAKWDGSATEGNYCSTVAWPEVNSRCSAPAPQLRSSISSEHHSILAQQCENVARLLHCSIVLWYCSRVDSMWDFLTLLIIVWLHFRQGWTFEIAWALKRELQKLNLWEGGSEQKRVYFWKSKILWVLKREYVKVKKLVIAFVRVSLEEGSPESKMQKHKSCNWTQDVVEGNAFADLWNYIKKDRMKRWVLGTKRLPKCGCMCIKNCIRPGDLTNKRTNVIVNSCGLH